MTLSEVYDVLQKIERCSSRSEKIQLLRINHSPTLIEVLKYALDPYITYGVNDVSFPIEYSSSEDDWERVKRLLTNLQHRAITGNAAKTAVYLVAGESLTAKGANVLNKILKKDLRCGVHAKTVNSAFPNCISEFSVMLAESGDIDHNFPLIIEPKYDGVRTIVVIQEGMIKYFSRNGKEFENFSVFDKHLSSHNSVVLDGEVIGVNFNQLMTMAKRKYNVDSSAIKFRVFDIMSINGVPTKESSTPLAIRKNWLETKVLPHIPVGSLSSLDTEAVVQQVPYFKVHSYKELNDMYNHFVSQGFEGAIVKTINGPYEYKRSKHWIKIKPTHTIDLPIINIAKGEGKYKDTLGALVVELNGKDVNVGSGYSDTDREELWKRHHRESLIGTVIEIKYQEMTPDGSLRFPIFVKLRGDK